MKLFSHLSLHFPLVCERKHAALQVIAGFRLNGSKSAELVYNLSTKSMHGLHEMIAQ